MENKSRDKISSVRQFYKGVYLFKDKIESALEKKIISEVEKEYQIPFQIISKRQNVAIKAKTMLLVLLGKHLYYTKQEIANKLKVSSALVSYRLRAFESVLNKNGSGNQISDNKIFYEDKFLQRYKAIDRIIIKYKRSLWQN